MKLSELIRPPEACFTGPLTPETEIHSLHYRSQEVRPGGLFFAIPGFQADGHQFIGDALARGAAGVVVQQPVAPGIPALRVENTRKAMGGLAARFYGNPSEDLCLIGITGTNGKTTTSLLTESLLSCAGFKTGVIGTIDWHYPGKRFDNPVTTPESPDLQRILARMRAAGVTHVVMEASSHAIDLHRLESLSFDVCVFTNLTQDHLDYHGDMARYRACKTRLFTEYLATGSKRDRAAAVVNGNVPEGRALSEILSVPCFTAGYSQENMIWSRDIRYGPDGIAGKIATPDGSFPFASPLTGAYNLENILCAVGVGVALGLPPEVMRAGIGALTLVPGRLEAVPDPGGRFIYVDYAHTPDALENVLKALRPLCAGRLICIFGCGGDRDREKRPLMGEIAGKLSDLAVVTSDNPRTEVPMTVIRHILPGVRQACSREYLLPELKGGLNGTGGYIVEPDRKQAIRLGIAAARAGDMVLIAGKGHETYQIIGSEQLPFDDRTEARRALETL
ncbi:UDP-N-acetylmuramoyl-L-alanyl-D-glutamate--2,6-d iaminopimelate ligase [Desulfonema ishimotonii]|uniref:UDP-N-acetylmuramoyl-L-alanyl-D-glutamate--2,6-diaminopimelate ligase n=1 Tax=Desulfonema ishimotonii TaxID=45657 RepID=A0A401FYE5_9BACT|nr:UDP-N-acetylmuramoyl-L-alanyl-D-glutamate--2,6-diaminopimelate ligase [Desulfonema ishimotonii]GBC61980.1 UDP-N-acetylmuramoyl-L-alanyl-D-glutamate--2,6-d iaminopimelate ligase [Desulfonema ishimotonii]